MKRKKILYGAGEDGCKALLQYGRKNVHCFVDRDPQKAGTLLQGVPIISVDEFCTIYRDYEVILSTGYFRSVLQDLRERGLDTTDFRIFYFERKKCWYEGNFYLWEWCARRENVARNQYIEEIIEKASHWDLLRSEADFREYEDCWRELEAQQPARGRFEWRHCSVFYESLYYGNLSALLQYAGCPRESAIYLPNVEHGVDLMGQCNPVSTNSVVYSKNRRDVLHHGDPGRPVFTIGPLIHYAKSIYTDAQAAQFKATLGKTVLVLPVHSSETYTSHYSEKEYVDAVFERYERDYDTIMVCVFFNDLFGETCKLFRERGAKIVSCGFRFDPLFIRRLKTLMMLSDCVSTNFGTTSVGYSVYLERPVDFFQASEISLDFWGQRHDNKSVQGQNQRMKELFCDPSRGITTEQREYVEAYWGLSQIRTPEEIRAMVAVSKKLLRACMGQLSLYQKTAPWVLKALSLRRDSFGMLQHRILKEALGQ